MTKTGILIEIENNAVELISLEAEKSTDTSGIAFLKRFTAS